MIVNISDFVGKYQLHSGTYVNANIQAYIDKYEPKYLRELFGADLYSEFLSDLDALTNEPQSPNFRYVYFPFAEDVNVYQMLVSEGIKEMLLGFIYFEYSKDLQNQMTPYGNVQNKSELSNTVGTLSSMIWTRYNESVRTFMAIRDWIFLNWNKSTGQIVQLTLLENEPNYGNGHKFLSIANGWALSANIDMTGSLYQVGETLSVGNNGMKIEVTQVGPNGELVDFDIIQNGYGYNVGSIYQLGAGYGSGAQLEITQVGNSVGVITGNASVIVQAEPIGGLLSLSINTFGNGYTDENNVPVVYGGSGVGGYVDIVADPNTTALLQVTPSNNIGMQYFPGDLVTIDQNGNTSGDAFVATVTEGYIQTITLTPSVGANTANFQYGDRVRITGNISGANAVYEVTYVGIGDFSKYNGYEKQMAYWI